MFEVTAPDGSPHLIAGDTLFAGSIGRTDLPGGDYTTLINSIRTVLLAFGDTCPCSSRALRVDDDWTGTTHQPVPAVTGRLKLCAGCGRLLGFLDDELDPAGADPIPGLSVRRVMRSSFTKVPFVLSRSSSSRPPSRWRGEPAVESRESGASTTKSARVARPRVLIEPGISRNVNGSVTGVVRCRQFPHETAGMIPRHG